MARRKAKHRPVNWTYLAYVVLGWFVAYLITLYLLTGLLLSLSFRPLDQGDLALFRSLFFILALLTTIKIVRRR